MYQRRRRRQRVAVVELFELNLVTWELCVFIFLVRSLLVQPYVFVHINICTTKFLEMREFAVYTIMTIMLFE